MNLLLPIGTIFRKAADPTKLRIPLSMTALVALRSWPLTATTDGDVTVFSLATDVTEPLAYELCLDMVSLEVVPYTVVAPIHVATVFGNTARRKFPGGVLLKQEGEVCTVLQNAGKNCLWKLPRFVMDKLASFLGADKKGSDFMVCHACLRQIFPDEEGLRDVHQRRPRKWTSPLSRRRQHSDKPRKRRWCPYRCWCGWPCILPLGHGWACHCYECYHERCLDADQAKQISGFTHGAQILKSAKPPGPRSSRRQRQGDNHCSKTDPAREDLDMFVTASGKQRPVKGIEDFDELEDAEFATACKTDLAEIFTEQSTTRQSTPPRSDPSTSTWKLRKQVEHAGLVPFFLAVAQRSCRAHLRALKLNVFFC